MIMFLFPFSFNERNVVISGTHTHSGPSGYFQFLLFEVTSLGHIDQSTETLIDGIVTSIEAGLSQRFLTNIDSGVARGVKWGTRPWSQALGVHQHTSISYSKTRF